jgi:L-amino acid N-acyltransferase YncA
VGRTANGGELCYIQWLVSRKDGEVVKSGFQSRLPSLNEDDILVENAFTFRKYRGKGVYPSALTRLAEISRGKGFKRMLVYVKEDNIASLKGCEKAGFRVFERVPEVKLLFSTRRKRS